MVWTSHKAKHRRTYQEPYGEAPAESGSSAAIPATDPGTPDPVPAGSYSSAADPGVARSEEGPVVTSSHTTVPPRGMVEGPGAPVAVRSYHPIRIGAMATLVILLGAWAALVAFIGPSFDYQATSTSSWRWTTTNWLLHLVPGAVAFAGGFLILALWPRTSSAAARVISPGDPRRRGGRSLVGDRTSCLAGHRILFGVWSLGQRLDLVSASGRRQPRPWPFDRLPRGHVARGDGCQGGDHQSGDNGTSPRGGIARLREGMIRGSRSQTGNSTGKGGCVMPQTAILLTSSPACPYRYWS